MILIDFVVEHFFELIDYNLDNIQEVNYYQILP
jgi:hypothetical protein